MKLSTGFLTQICGTSGSKEHGTGFLVSPKHVLTCAHVVFGVDHRSQILWPERNGIDKTVVVVFGYPAKPYSRLGKIVKWEAPDLALIELDVSVPKDAVPFLTGLEQGDFQSITRRSNAIVGYERKKRSLTRAAVERVLFSTGNEAGPLTVQIDGGIPEGMSGSPALVEVDAAWACWGMVYIGRDGAATSRLISSEQILRFLRRAHVHCDFIRAGTSLFATPGAFIEKVCAQQEVTKHSVAATLDIPESTVEDWIKNDLTPSGYSRRRLTDLLGARHSTFKPELERRISRRAGGRAQQDIISLLRGFPRERHAELDFMAPSDLALSLLSHSVLSVPWQRRFRGGSSARTANIKGVATPLGRDERRVLGIGSEKNIRVNLQLRVYVTFVDVTRTESEEREYWCLDSLLGIDQALPIGESLLPFGGRTVPIHGPLGHGCLIMLARESKPFRWNGEKNREGLTKVGHDELLRVMKRLRLSAKEHLVGLCEYRVIE